MAIPLLEVDFHSVTAHKVPSPPGAGPEGECFTSLDPNLSGCNYAGIPRRVLSPADQSRPNVLVPGAPAVTFQAQASLRAGSSANSLGVAAGALAYVAWLTNTQTQDVPTVQVQVVMVTRLRTALTFFMSSMAGGAAFAAEQLAGVLGIPRTNINDDWAQPWPLPGDCDNYTAAFSAWARQQGSTCEPARGAAFSAGSNVSKLAFLTALVATCPQELSLSALASNESLAQGPQTPIHLSDVVELVFRAMLLFVPGPLRPTAVVPYTFQYTGFYDSFHRSTAGAFPLPSQPEFAGLGCRYVASRGASIPQGNLILSGGRAFLMAQAMSAAGLGQGFNATVEMLPVLEGPGQPLPGTAGLAWNCEPGSLSSCSFFGLLQAPTNASSDSIVFALWDSVSQVNITQPAAWPLAGSGGMASFTLRLRVHLNTGGVIAIACFANDVQIFSVGLATFKAAHPLTGYFALLTTSGSAAFQHWRVQQ